MEGAGGIFWIIVIALFGGLLIRNFMRGQHTADENQFSQAGVSVLFADGKVVIKNKEFDVNKIQSIRTEKVTFKNRTRSVCYIDIDDFDKPLHKVEFAYANQASEFSNRLALAIKKAGGPALS